MVHQGVGCFRARYPFPNATHCAVMLNVTSNKKLDSIKIRIRVCVGSMQLVEGCSEENSVWIYLQERMKCGKNRRRDRRVACHKKSFGHLFKS